MKIEFKHLLRGLAATAAFGAIALPAAAPALPPGDVAPPAAA